MRLFYRLVLFCVLTAAFAHASNGQPADKLPSLISVSGEGEVAIVPDLAILRGGVTTAAKTAREASEAHAKPMTAVMTSIKAGGIADQDVQTSRLSLQPMHDRDQHITGFQAANQVTIKIRDMGKISDVIDRLVGAGSNDISGIQFVVSSPSKPLDQAREAAIADARRKAEIYARAANVKLGSAINITEEGSAGPRPGFMLSAARSSTPVSPGEEIQRVSVTVSYELLR